MRNKVLVVDDIELNREILGEMLEEDYEIVEADNGEKALEMIERDYGDYAAVLLDLVMPGMSGIDVLTKLQGTEILSKVPVLVITGDTNAETEKNCFDLGVVDFIGKPFNTAIVKRRVQTAAELYDYKDGLERTVQKQTESLRQQNEQLMVQAEKLRTNYINIIEVLGTVIEARNMESGEHIKRVKDYTRILANTMLRLYPDSGLNEHIVEVIVSASPLHDIGKVMISDSVLLKPGRLSDEERTYIQTHTLRGCEILEKVKGIWDEEYGRVSIDICRHHHERWDGRGYPDGLAGNDIPISAQLVALADVYDALVNERVYKKAFSLNKAFNMITDGQCGLFPPRILDCFRAARAELEAHVSNPAPDET